ncbi:S8 family serine peptidase [Kangiella sp. TOML190]|uniref:S8 family serine peptidase n=1 Tax=Kangiella sp. TOML190 TaxID=2931351 RepID=UPI00203D9D06|nr:S8 family serine peptidase [Kangiella sp. TOML190]
MKKPFNKALAPIAVSCALAAASVTAVEYDSNGEPIFDFEAYSSQANQEIGAGLIIKYRNSSAQTKRASISNSKAMSQLSARLGVKAKHKRFNAFGSQIVDFDSKQSVRALERMAAKLRSDSDIEYVEVNRIMKPFATANDTHYGVQWHYTDPTSGINLESAWDTTQGEGVTVAVLDTGITNHSDLNANVIGGYDFISNTTYSNDGNGRDSDASDPGDWTTGQCGPASNSSWHGTHVAGTIGAVTNNNQGVAGVAYKSKIVPVRVLGTCGGTTADIADAIIWSAGGIVSGVPTNPNPAKVINMSLGGSGSCSTTTQNAINSARANGTVVVVAAGNSNANVSGFNPGNCSGVISVAATNKQANRASYSNYGSLIDIAAPGGEGGADGVASTVNSGSQGPTTESYAYYAGTSMAAPHVAGVAALMFAVNPNLTPDEVESRLKSSAKSFPSGSSCSTANCGDGMLDAAAAIAAAQGGGNPPPTGDGVLEKGVAQTGLSGATGSETFFTIDVPAGATNLSFTMSGGTGDADLYTRRGAKPTTSSYDCRPYKAGNSETCTVAAPAADTYHVMIRGYSAYSGVTLVADYTEATTPPPGGSNEFTNNTNVNIYDNTTVSSSVNVTGRTSIGNIDIIVDIKHTYIGDLEVKIIAPDGKSAVLHNRTGGSANDIQQTYSLNASSVSNSGNGTWRLQVNDNYNGDTGYIDTWTLKFK